MDQVRLRDYCDEARSFIQCGKFDRAINIARHVLGYYPRHVASYRLLGEALLGERNYREAGQQFRRVLSADPEDLAARLGLAKIYEATGDLNKAIWHMQRAFELSPAKADLRQQLHRLINTQAGDSAPLPEITRAALGRIHARGGLYAKAIQELKAVLSQHPTRFDVQVSLAEALWQGGRRSEAAEVCHHILEDHPNALKANLIIAAAWLENRQPQKAEPYLEQAQALDPENIVAQSLFGEQSPLPTHTVEIERLSEFEAKETQPQPPPTLPGEDVPPLPKTEEAVAGMSELHEEETAPMSNEERPDDGIELPDWLQGLGDDLLDEETPSEEPAAESTDDEDDVDWLRDLVARTSGGAQDSDEPATQPPPQEKPAAPTEPPSAEIDDTPSWLKDLQPEAPPPVEPSEETPAVSEPSETPDWLLSVMSGQPLDDTQPESPAEAEEPSFPPLDADEEVETPPVSFEPSEPAALESMDDTVEGSDVPDWLRDIATGESAPPAEEQPAEAAQPITQPPPPPQPADESMAGADEGRALWEQILAEEGVDLSSTEEALPPEAEGMSAEEWLRSTADVSQTRPAKKPTEPPPVEEPEAPLPPAAEPKIIEPLPSADMAAGDEEELPDWLAEAREEPAPTPSAEAEPADDTLDWLKDLREPATDVEPEEPEVEFEAEAKEATTLDRRGAEVEDEDLPDWLREPQAEAIPADKVPDWLKDLETEETPLEEPSLEEPIELETGQMPEWLDEVMTKETSLAEEWEEPTVPSTAEAEEPEAELPQWLREFREEETAAPEEPLAEAEEVEAKAEAEGLDAVELEGKAAPELPDWLRRLREGEPEGEAAIPQPPAAEIPEVTPEPSEAPIEVPAEPETIEPEAEGPEWLEDLVRDEESLAELEAVEEEITAKEAASYPEVEELELPQPEPEEAAEAVAAEAPPTEPEGKTPEPAMAAEKQITRYLEPLNVEDLPKDAETRLTMARAALNAGDWADALTIYETMVSSSESLDSVIEDLQGGLRRFPDDPRGYQLLGDACMKDGRLKEALQTYRIALTKL